MQLPKQCYLFPCFIAPYKETYIGDSTTTTKITMLSWFYHLFPWKNFHVARDAGMMERQSPTSLAGICDHQVRCISPGFGGQYAMISGQEVLGASQNNSFT